MPFYCSFYSIPRSIGIVCLLLQGKYKTWLLDCLSRHIYSIFVSNWPLVTTNHVTSFLSRSLLSDSILKCLHKENVCSLLYRISKKTSSLFFLHTQMQKRMELKEMKQLVIDSTFYVSRQKTYLCSQKAFEKCHKSLFI